MGFFDRYPYTNWHNVNLDWVLERVKEWGQMVEDNNTRFENLLQANEAFKEYVTNYLQNLDVQAEIDDKLDRMLESGILTEYFQPYISSATSTWLDEHITEPEGVIIDSSLTVAGACADAKTVGDILFPTEEKANAAVLYTAQSKNAHTKTIARDNIYAQEKLDIVYNETLFNPNTITRNKIIYAFDGIERDREGYFVSSYIDVSNMKYLYVSGIEVIGAFNSNNEAINPTLQPQISTLHGITYELNSNIKTVRVCAKLTNIDNVVVRNGEIEIPSLKLTEDQLLSVGNYTTVENYGGVGDGVADDTAAFQLAINDGRPIKLAAKTYKTNIYIDRSNVTIIGEWQKTTLIPADTSKPIIQINSDSAEYIEDLITYVLLKDFIIQGNYQNVIGIKARCCQTCYFERLMIHRCFAGGLVFEGVWDSRLRFCEVITCGNRGFETDDGNNNYSFVMSNTSRMKTNAIVVDGCRFEHSPRFLYIKNVFQVLIVNTKFESHTRAYNTDPEYAPIRVREQVKGLHFINDIFTYNAVLLSDDLLTDPFNNGIPFISVNTETSNATSERITTISNCQFASQPELVVVFFEGNQSIITGCNFDKCASNKAIVTLKNNCTFSNNEILLQSGGTAVKIDGNYCIVDNLRAYVITDDATKSIIEVTNNAVRGYAKVLYNGNDRNNLATAGSDGFNITVEFIGIRTYS